MTVGKIISAVRWCFDEEAMNGASFGYASSNDSTLMDNIIKAKIGYALRWVCLNAPAEMLTGSDSDGDAGIVQEDTINPSTSTTITDDDAGVVDGAPVTPEITGQYWRFALPANFLRLVRVRAKGWHRAVSGEALIQEDSDEYLQLHDPTCATATPDRPQAALINMKRKRLEIWPAATSNGAWVQYTCIVAPTSITTEPTTETVAIPPLVQSTFIYYLAFLVLSAYDDPRAVRMLEIAKMNISRTENTQNK